MSDRELFLVIRMNHASAGFFCYVTFVINQLIYAERHGLRPVVHFGPVSGDRDNRYHGTNAYYEAAYGENSWDYYFQPVAGITYEELQARVADPGEPLRENQVYRLSDDALWRLHLHEPESIYPWPYGMHGDGVADYEAWYAAQRARASHYVRRYIKLKPHISAKLDALADDLFGGRPAIGLHLRGTDKGAVEGVDPKLLRIMPPRVYIPYVERFLNEHPDGLVFVATDQRQFADRLQRHYGDRFRCLDAIRSSTFINSFLDRGSSGGYRKGEEVLLDALLLSRCTHLIKCTSAVGEYALYVNPTLPSVDVNLLDDPWPRLSEARAWFAYFRWRLARRLNPKLLGRTRTGDLLLTPFDR